MGSTTDVHTALSLRVRQQALDTVLRSSTFGRNPRLGNLLQYLCSKSFAGQSGSLKEYAIATDVFGRAPEFDQSTDSIVRVEMHRLRKKLKEFYAGEGATEEIEILIQSGRYAPEFLARSFERGEWKTDPVPVTDIAPASRAGWTSRWLPIFAASLILVIGIAIAVASRNKSAGISVPDQHPAVLPATDVVMSSDAVRILSGHLRGRIRDRDGNTWGSDDYFQGGTAIEIAEQPIYRTHNPSLFRSARSGNFAYNIPLKAGLYELHLYFADTSFKPGISMEGGENLRYFNITLNDRPLLSNFDIIASSAPNTAYERIFRNVQPAADGHLHLRFSNAVGAPIVNAIEILPALPHGVRPIRISTQDNGFIDKSGLSWEPDNYFLNGRSIAKFGIPSGPVDAQIYERERYGNFSYAIPAPPGKYHLNLHFAETYFGPGEQGGGGVGDRLFDVYCNGIALIRNLDVFSEAGAGHELIKIFHGVEPNAQGNVLLSFVPRKNYAMISAIELIDESGQ